VTTFHASPESRSFAPSKWFGPEDADLALAYARKAAAVFHVGYRVWRIDGGRFRLLKRFTPDRGKCDT
jgi:hypothetical protein